MRRCGRILCALLALGRLGLPDAAHAAEHVSAEAKARDGTVLYVEQHWLFREQERNARLVLYTCPDGKPFARKTIRYSADMQAPDFELEDARDGFLEGVRTRGDTREVFIRERAETPPLSQTLRIDANTVIDAGFDEFVRTHWDALIQHQSVPLDFVVPSKLAAIGFSASGIGEEQIQGRAAQRFRLGLARWYGAFLPHIEVVYDAQTRKLLRYEGIGSIRSADAHHLAVRIDFPLDGYRDDADAAQIAAAANARLDGTCPL